MKKVLMIVSILAFAVSTSVTAQNVYHKYIMRGSILESSGGDVYMCIGKVDGAQAGQELDVYRIDVKPGANPKTAPKFTRVKIGKVKITEIVEEHYARAKVVSGTAPKGAIVEVQMGK